MSRVEKGDKGALIARLLCAQLRESSQNGIGRSGELRAW